MDALFNVFGFGMQKPDEKWKFFENQKNRNIEQQEEKKRGIFWRDKKNQHKGISNLDMGPLGSMEGTDQGKGGSILPSNINYPGNINQAQQQGTTPFHPSQGGKNQSLAGDQNLSWLAKLTGTNMDKAMAHWKDKGGFEGLMSNPAFTMGLAFMQAGAEGKTLGQGSLDNVMKAAGISSHYKRIIEAKSGGVIEATTGQMDDIKGILGTMGISGPGWRKMLPGNQSESYEQAVEDITIKVQQKVNKMKEDAKKSGKDIVVGSRLKKKIIQDMIDSGEINTKRVFFDKTLESKPVRARGGPVTKGKAYVVGEEGPEVIIPHSSGNVLSTDDSQIFAMLLAANPQLQKVSKARAEKIMRSRFPEYFE